MISAQIWPQTNLIVKFTWVKHQFVSPKFFFNAISSIHSRATTMTSWHFSHYAASNDTQVYQKTKSMCDSSSQVRSGHSGSFCIHTRVIAQRYWWCFHACICCSCFKSCKQKSVFPKGLWLKGQAWSDDFESITLLNSRHTRGALSPTSQMMSQRPFGSSVCFFLSIAFDQIEIERRERHHCDFAELPNRLICNLAAST